MTPLPYTLSLPLTLALRDFVAHWATAIAAGFGLDVAVDSAAVFVDQFELAVENACAGLNSTVSLVAIGLMFAYLQRARGWPSVLSVALLALPIAMIANVLRVVVLLFAVHWGGARVLDTPLHPISGLVSFSLALLLLVLATGALDRIRAEARR